MTVHMSGFKTALRASLAVMFLMTMLLATAMPAGAASSPISSAIVPMGTTDNVLDSTVTNNHENLLQFTSSGHVLGFSRDGVIIASREHMLKTEFIGSRAVAPEADTEVSTEDSSGMASPLSRVTYHNIWDDVTVIFGASPGTIVKSTYYVNATEMGVPVERIRLGYNRPLFIDEKGNLVIAYETGTMVESAPVAWQEVDGQRKPVTVAFALYGEFEVGFSLADYVPGIPVVIDPDLTWNTFLGGDGYDYGTAIAVDGTGNVYVAGDSDATWGDSPVRGYTASDSDAFAAKLSSSGTLLWHTFLGGDGGDYGSAIAVDGTGNVYVGGSSNATWGSPKRAYTTSTMDAFAAKLNSDGTLLWNTFLGGSGYDIGFGIAVDGIGNVYVAGWSAADWGTPRRGYTLGRDAFAAKLDNSGNLIWNTFLGGNGWDNGLGIAVDGSNNVYVTGDSDEDWGVGPVRAYTYDDAFVAKLDSDGNLLWHTFLGGEEGYECGYGIAVDGSSNVYVGGDSDATWEDEAVWEDDPVRGYTGDNDAFAAKLDSDGNLLWHTFLGGDDYDTGRAIAIDSSANVYVGGHSYATWGSPAQSFQGDDAFAAKLDNSGNLIWNTFVGGGSGWEEGHGIAVGGSDNVHVAGYCNTAWGDPRRDYTANHDAFAAKLGQTPPTVTTTTATDITTTTATLNMDYDFKDYGSGTVQFAYKKTADSIWTYTLWQAKSASGSYAEPLTGLTSNAEYQFKARLKYDSTEIEGSVLTFTTPITPEVDTAVGGNVVPVNKIALLVPWLVLSVAIMAGGIVLVWRRVHVSK